jgi:hypothetical protein
LQKQDGEMASMADDDRSEIEQYHVPWTFTDIPFAISTHWTVAQITKK